MKNRLILIGICIAAVGLIALPQTLALFAGQHTFYEVSRDPQNLGVPCEKCHADVYSELSGDSNKVHKTVSCETCHVIALTNKGAKVGGNESIHAAATPACMDCHGGNSSYPNATSILYGANESHKKFAEDAAAPNAKLLKGANEACVGCHTHTNVDIVWQRPTNLSFNASVIQGVWNVTNFTAGGVKTTKTTGNATGNGSVVPP